MNIYKRYFRVTSGPLMNKAAELEAANAEARKALVAFCKEIGADDAMTHREGTWAGFSFGKTPDQKVWKQPNSFGAYWPRKNTAGGREMLSRIEALPRIVPVAFALEAVGLHPTLPALVSGLRFYTSAMTGGASVGVVFVSVPWRDTAPDELEDYKRNREAGGHMSCEMDHLCWSPTADMVELKRWEVEREIDELNARRQLKKEEVAHG